MAYSPFDHRSVKDLTCSDLEALVTNGVAEGYTVEFKREPVSNEKLARSLASFANTIGGWYIVGVVTDKMNVAAAVPGFDLRDRDYLSTIRDVAISRIDPTPIFEARTMDLEDGKSVVIVHIPSNQATPFITADGRIYRREADSSLPVHEHDRHSVDRLVDGGRDREKWLVRFMNAREHDVPENLLALELFLAPEPMPQKATHADELTTKGIPAILDRLKQPMDLSLDEPGSLSATAPFLSASFREYSVVLRQTPPEDPFGVSPELELCVDGPARILAPLVPAGDVGSVDIDLLDSAQSRQAISGVRRYCTSNASDRSLRDLQLYDLGPALLSAAILARFYLEWAGDDLWTRKVKVSWRVVNSVDVRGRAVVFSDSDAWGDHVVRYGLPVAQRRTYHVDRPESIVIDLDESPSLWVNCLEAVSWSLGVGDAFGGMFAEALARAARRGTIQSAEAASESRAQGTSAEQALPADGVRCEQ